MTYSVVIRTLGKTGEKYKQLLDSIDKQTLKPEEVIVAIPQGYSLDHELGYERFVYCEKGMIKQRVAGIDAAKSDFILVVDDDISFGPDFAELMMKAVADTGADAIAPSHEGDEKDVRLSKLVVSNLKYVFVGQRFLMRSKEWWVKCAATGGHIINLWTKKDRYYKTQSWNFQCFFMNTQKAKDVRFIEELWLEAMGYAIFDDQVFAYKSFLQGNKAFYAPMIEYKHLDGGSGHATNRSELERLSRKLYGNNRNRTIFWYKFMYAKAGFFSKIWLVICNLYATTNTFLLYFFGLILKPKNLIASFSVWKGCFDGLSFCKNELK